MISHSIFSIWFIIPFNIQYQIHQPYESIFLLNTTNPLIAQLWQRHKIIFPHQEKGEREHILSSLRWNLVSLQKQRSLDTRRHSWLSVLIRVPWRPHLHSSPETSLITYKLFNYEMTLGQDNMFDHVKGQSKEHQHSVAQVQFRRQTSEAFKCPMAPPKGFKRSSFFPTWILAIPRS